MRMFHKLFAKQKIPIKKIRFPPCGREYCYCVKTTDLNKKKNLEMYFDCYRTWYKYVS